MGRTVEEALEFHSARRYLYALVQSLTGGEPTADRLDAIDGALMAEALGILGLDDDFGLAGRIEEARGDADAACGSFTRLFIGPATLKAMPWESTYRSRSQALFRQETLDVRNAYRAQGFLPKSYPKVADDHIALECGFLSALAGRAIEGLESGDDGARIAAEEASRSFLDEHVLKWVGPYADDLAKEGQGTLYESLARLIAALAERDREFLG